MGENDTRSEFKTRLLRPIESGDTNEWAFVVLPQEASARLPRRGRTTIDGVINGEAFRAQLEPDGQKSHWLKIDRELLEASGATFGEIAQFEVVAVKREPEPKVPADLYEALENSPESRATWDKTTTIARVDWIHWITSAKQSKTRAKRVTDACDMLAQGKKRVCCFDPSGYYSRALSAPRSTD